MNSNFHRRDFLKAASTLAAGVALANLGPRSAAAAEKVSSSSPAAAKVGWQVAVEQYTFRRFGLYEALDFMAKLGIVAIEPGFFLSLDKARPALKPNEDLAADVRKELKAKLDDRGMAMTSFYGNLDADQGRARKIFDFCKEMGAGTVVSEPPVAALDMIEKLCDEYKINLAIHNHPKPHSNYWHPEKIVAACKGRGKRIGSCCDTGHWVRSGLKPVECLKMLEGRILSFHLKDVIEEGKPEARDVPLGEGKADYPAIMKELKRQGYQGVLTIEYEHDSPELMDDVAKCVAFVEKMAKELA
jgi:L-ribulose-5-phosphate 3-epimerase